MRSNRRKQSKRPVVSDYSKVRRRSTLVNGATKIQPIPRRLIQPRWLILKPQIVAKKPRIRKDPYAFSRTIEPVRRIRSCNYRKQMMRKLAAQVKASGGSLASWRKTLSNKSHKDCRS